MKTNTKFAAPSGFDPTSDGAAKRINGPTPAIGHMTFKGHRTQKQVREDEERAAILRSLGRDR